jgi:hypothetical protein
VGSPEYQVPSPEYLVTPQGKYLTLIAALERCAISGSAAERAAAKPGFLTSFGMTGVLVRDDRASRRLPQINDRGGVG